MIDARLLARGLRHKIVISFYFRRSLSFSKIQSYRHPDQRLAERGAMKAGKILLALVAVLLATASATSNASAFCGVLQASATGYSREEALNKANNKGLVEVRKLESNYGSNNVHYNPASSTCREGGTVSCSITQKFCVDSGGPQRPARGEEGGSVHGCPPGTKPVPETDNCVPVRGRSGDFEKAPWKRPGCNSWKQRCNQGDGRACAKYEAACQVN